MTFSKDLTPEQLQAALSSVACVSVRLHGSNTMQHPPPNLPSLMVAALPRSASTLAVLHGLTLVEPQNDQQLGLAAFTRLCALTLRQTDDLDTFIATYLPASLVDITLIQDLPESDEAVDMDPPFIVGLEQLAALKRVTFEDYCSWRLGSWLHDGGQECPQQFPPSVEVCSLRSVIVNRNFLLLHKFGAASAIPQGLPQLLLVHICPIVRGLHERVRAVTLNCMLDRR